MKWHKIFASFLVFFLTFVPLDYVFAETKIKPDIRASTIHVNTRPMPTRKCWNRTPEEWVRSYVGFNRITGNKIKFYSDLVPDANQLGSAMDKLLPYLVDKNDIPQTEEPDPVNNPVWNGQICVYRDTGEKFSYPSDQLIITEGPVPQGVKQHRWDWEIFSAIVARNSISLTNGTYDMRQTAVSPDTNNPLPCGINPPGVTQQDKKDENQGENLFAGFAGFIEEAYVEAACTTPSAGCECVNTKMVIEPDSTVPYSTFLGCEGGGCKDEKGVQDAVLQADPAHRADEKAVESGGAVNAYRHGIMPPLFRYVEEHIGSVMGVQKDQSTTNNQNTKINDSSWSFMKELEVIFDFLLCNNLPFSNRPTVCNTKWLGYLIGNIQNQLQGTGSQNTSEPAQ